MAVSVKFALCSSLVFIAGMFGLVQQAERAIAGLPLPGAGVAFAAETSPDVGYARSGYVETAPQTLLDVRPLNPSEGVALEGRFEHATPLERETAARPMDQFGLPPKELVFAPPDEAPLPPLADPAARGTTIAEVLEATVLAARRPEPEPAGEATYADEPLTPAGQATPTDSPASDGGSVAAVAVSSVQPAAQPPAEAEPTGPTPGATYRVVRGDSLSRIARQAWGSDGLREINALLAANPMLKNEANRLQAGHQLVIPARPLPVARGDNKSFVKKTDKAGAGRAERSSGRERARVDAAKSRRASPGSSH